MTSMIVNPRLVAGYAVNELWLCIMAQRGRTTLFKQYGVKIAENGQSGGDYGWLGVTPLVSETRRMA
jgi:hypothetical protein